MNKFDSVMMDTAITWAKQSYCKRRKVGAILAKDGRVVSNGYNGTASGGDNGCEELVDTCPSCGKSFIYDDKNPDNNEVSTHKCSCGATIDYTLDFLEKNKSKFLKSKDSVIHAEANTILFAAKNGISTNGCTLYVTLSPCIECSKMIIQSGIKRVVYLSEYRVTTGIDFLINNSIQVDQISHKDADEDLDSFLRDDGISVCS